MNVTSRHSKDERHISALVAFLGVITSSLSKGCCYLVSASIIACSGLSGGAKFGGQDRLYSGKHIKKGGHYLQLNLTHRNNTSQPDETMADLGVQTFAERYRPTPSHSYNNLLRLFHS